MQILIKLFIFVIFISPIKLLADEAPVIKVSFYENATFQGRWEIEINKQGNLVAEAEKNMLDFKGQKEQLVTEINKDELTNLCVYIKEKGFFEINTHYSTSKSVMVDGPEVHLVISCGGLANRVTYYPNHGDTSDITSQEIEAIWQKVWSYSKVKAPSLTKYM